MILKKPESFDIDTIYDFKISELYYKKKKSINLYKIYVEAFLIDCSSIFYKGHCF